MARVICKCKLNDQLLWDMHYDPKTDKLEVNEEEDEE